jgi:hypothetical protein
MTMKIDASRVCREALQRKPEDKDLGAALLYAANKVYRKRTAEVGLAVLEMVEQYAARFGKCRLDTMAEFAAGAVTIEKVHSRFGAGPRASSAECLAALAGPRAAAHEQAPAAGWAQQAATGAK